MAYLTSWSPSFCTLCPCTPSSSVHESLKLRIISSVISRNEEPRNYQCFFTLVNCNDISIAEDFLGFIAHWADVAANQEGCLVKGVHNLLILLDTFVLDLGWLQWHSAQMKAYIITFTRAQMLKWERYSSVVIPPFPTSSMSGSESRDCSSSKWKHAGCWKCLQAWRTYHSIHQVLRMMPTCHSCRR